MNRCRIFRAISNFSSIIANSNQIKPVLAQTNKKYILLMHTSKNAPPNSWYWFASSLCKNVQILGCGVCKKDLHITCLESPSLSSTTMCTIPRTYAAAAGCGQKAFLSSAPRKLGSRKNPRGDALSCLKCHSVGKLFYGCGRSRSFFNNQYPWEKILYLISRLLGLECVWKG